MESGSNSTSCPMAFAGDNSDGPMCPMMMMMMPVITSHQQHHGHDQQHQHQQQHDGYAYQSHHQQSSSLFLQSLTPPSQEAKNKVRSSCSPSSGAPAYSFMEINHQNELLAGGLNPCSSASVKAKIMGHPHYHRLLLAYVNCQKVMVKENPFYKNYTMNDFLTNDPCLIVYTKKQKILETLVTKLYPFFYFFHNPFITLMF